MNCTKVDQRCASISFRQLKLFAMVGRCGGIQRAAQACGLSQPAATQALALMQERIGLPLLERGVTGSTLSSHGQILHPRIESILASLETAIGALGIEAPDPVLRALSATQLRTLAALRETGSLERAAQQTGLTRAGLRRSMVALERLTGPLLSRTQTGNCLTPRGDSLAGIACSLREDAALAIRELHAAQADRGNTIIVGAAQAFGNRLLARVLTELGSRHTQARITVLRESPAELVDRLRAGEVDLVVGDIEQTGPNMVKERLVATPYFIFGRPGHPLSGPDSITIAQLADYDWVGGTEGSAREAAREALFAGERAPHVAFAASEGAVVGHFVAGSDRLALMTEHESRCGGLALAKMPFVPVEAGLGIDVVRRADRVPSALHSELVDMLHKELAPAVPMQPPVRKRHAA